MNITDLINTLPWHPSRKWSKRPLSKINKIILHQELADGTIEAVNNYHINPNHISDRGCPHFCYHFGIRKNGEVIQANNYDDVTWHTKNQNSVSIGVMLEGNFKGTGHNLGAEKPTDAQMKSVEEIVEFLKDKFNLTNQDVYGHYHYGKPACPGYHVSEWIENLRSTSTLPTATVTSKNIQEMLNQLGYDAGPTDGIIGIKTISAIRAFQKDQQLTVDGIAGTQTILKLLSLT